MTIGQTIWVHGHSFQVKSEQPLTEYQNNFLISAMEQFTQKQMEVLAVGKKGEPPLKIYVVSRDQWSVIDAHPASYVTKSIDHMEGYYCIRSNLIMLDIGKIPSHPAFNADGKERSNENSKKYIQHELGHALDDFAVTRFANFTMYEDGTASTAYSDTFFTEGTGRKQLPLIFLGFLAIHYGYHDNCNIELFAAANYYLIDPRRQEKFGRYVEYLRDNPHLLGFLTGQQEECAEEKCIEMGKQLRENPLSLSEFEQNNPFLQTMKTFFANYPQIPCVSLEEQYDTGFWLSILRIRLW